MSEPEPTTPAQTEDQPTTSQTDVTPKSTPLGADNRTPVHVTRSAPRWLAPLALVIAIVAVALAGWALAKSPANPAATNVIGGSGDPKARVCTAFDVVSRAVQSQTNNDLGQDPIAQSAVAGNARLALLGGGAYLEASLGTDAPDALKDPTRRFANALQTIGMNALAGVTNSDPTQAARLSDANADRQQIVDACK